MIAMIAILALTLMVPLASYASVEGRRNTAAVLTGATAYFLSKGETEAGIASAFGAIVAWDRYGDARDDRRFDRHRRYYYRDYDRDRDRDRDRFRDRDYRWDRDRDRDRDHRWDRDRRHDRGLHLGWERGKRLGHYKNDKHRW